MDQIGFIPKMYRRFNISELIKIIYHISRTRHIHHNIVPTDAEKAFDKIQHDFNIKALKILETKGVCPNITKASYDRPMVNTILNMGKAGSDCVFLENSHLNGCYFPCFSFRFYSFLGVT